MLATIIVLGAIGLTLLVIAGVALRKAPGWKYAFGIFFLALAGVLLLIGSITTVPAQNTGVVTQLGKTKKKVYGPGFHWKLVTEKIHDMDGTMQQVDNEGHHATAVRLNTNSIMYVQNNLRWKILPTAAPQLFRDWKKFDNIQDGLITKELASALNVELANYDALDPGKPGQSSDELEQKVIARLNSRIGKDAPDPEINIVTFTIQRIDFDPATQARLNQYQGQVAKTRTANERIRTNQADAKANQVLKESLAGDPMVLVSKCLDIQQEAVDKGLKADLGSCWPINGVTVTKSAQ